MPDIQPLTLVWRVKVSQQNGYYTTFFHGRTDGSFLGDMTYFGCHPYPKTPPSGSTHWWEISCNGNDYYTDANSNDTTVSYDTWMLQAAVCWNSGGDAHINFYWNLAAGASRVIQFTGVGSSFTNNANSPALVFGDAPWSVSNERMNGSLGQVKVFSTNLSESDIVSEAGDMNTIVTSAGAAARWWFKPGFSSVDDLTDSVTGKSGAWVNSSYKATLGEAL